MSVEEDLLTLAKAFLSAYTRAGTMYCQRCDLSEHDSELPCGCRPTKAEDDALQIMLRLVEDRHDGN